MGVCLDRYVIMQDHAEAEGYYCGRNNNCLIHHRLHSCKVLWCYVLNVQQLGTILYRLMNSDTLVDILSVIQYQ